MVAVSALITIGWALLWTLMILPGLLLLVFLALLFVPTKLTLRLDSDLSSRDWEAKLSGAARWLVRLHWKWMGVAGEWAGENLHLTRVEFRILGLRFRPGLRFRSRAGSRPPYRRADQQRRRPPGFDLRLLAAVLQECGRFAKWLITTTGFRFRGEIRYSFRDPALTGWAEAIRRAAATPAPIRLQPDFRRPCLEGWAVAEGRLYGYRLAGAVLRSMGHPIIRSRLTRRIRSRPLRYLLTRVVLRGG